MDLHAQHLIGASTSREGRATFRAVDPTSGAALEPEFADATELEVDAALRLAADAHPAFEACGRARRAAFLERVAEGIEALGPALIERAGRETGLPAGRLEGERGRTCAQLRLFAGVVREGGFLDARIDRADPGRAPLPKPDVRSMQRALGPVVVFGASNFPLAFSVAGGDTASALAAGCPVVVKAHPAHPGTCELVGRALVEAVRAVDLPEGTFSMVHGAGTAVGALLVQHPATRAVGFTGSHAGGRALFDLAARRPVPVPVYAEMGSTNPVFVLPAALAASGAAIARGLADSVTLGAGQFCTNPGLVVVQNGPATRAFLSELANAMSEKSAATMLHAGIHAGYVRRLGEVAAVPGVDLLVDGTPAPGSCASAASLLSTDAATFLEHATLSLEVFGPSTLVVLCESDDEMSTVAHGLVGQLTATVHADEADGPLLDELAAVLEQKAGRVLFGGFPTGVEVGHAMVHGGPYPATTDARSTSVGTRAVRRFTRPVCWQNAPQERLPEELRDAAPAGLLRLVDGAWSRS